MNGPLIVIIHVDDAVVFGQDVKEIEKMKDGLKKEYKINDMGELKW